MKLLNSNMPLSRVGMKQMIFSVPWETIRDSHKGMFWDICGAVSSLIFSYLVCP